ncbi:MAG TPA: NrfD/PsrC family molybdoenzyme membrane anchor subunit [Solirubrobacteraceae bacterium]|nr:NrfD/PsrC family molybdoenzyme membrane anchor subunit [Solirubrobacteraceae bacterium]
MSSGNGASPEHITSYHGQPVLKEPVWSQEIPLYFYLGGVAGASGGLAYLSELRGNPELARRSYAVAMAALAVSPGLLISDLGRPERFLNMLRMFKVTSPMSVGSWILSGSGTATALAAANAWTGWLPGPARVARPAAALLGLPLSTYTAALIANTAVPVWHEARRLLPWVFGSGAALGAGAAAVMVTPPAEAAPARRLALGAAALEGPLMELMVHRLGRQGEPYKHGTPAVAANVSRAAIISGAALLFRHGETSRPAAIAAGGLLSLGALATRLSVFKAGFSSAADPKYVIRPQRLGITQGLRKGASRGDPRVGPPADLGSPATVR